jgi:hypothetical protein
MEKEHTNRAISRKKFVVWSAGIISVLGAAKYFFRSTSKTSAKDTKTVKMLGQDGRLVEIEVSKLPTKRKKIKDTDIHTWVRRKPSL